MTDSFPPDQSATNIVDTLHLSGGTGGMAWAVMPIAAPNLRLLDALKTIAVIHQGVPYSSGDRTVEIIREARAGEMYDNPSNH